jgi:hypothetical protein
VDSANARFRVAKRAQSGTEQDPNWCRDPVPPEQCAERFSPPRSHVCINSIIEDWINPAGNQTNGMFRRSRKRTVFASLMYGLGHCQDHSILREFQMCQFLRADVVVLDLRMLKCQRT